MISTNDIYKEVQNLAQKAKFGTVSPQQFNQYGSLASKDLFNERLGSIKDYYRLGKAMAKTSSGMNKDIDQSLRPFLVPDVNAGVSSGVVTLPGDCEFIDSILYGTVPVKWVPKNKEGNYLNSTIDFPTVEYPIYIDLPTQVRVYPTTITSVKLSYYKTPSDIVWNYTLVSGRPVYNSVGTVNFEWMPSDKTALIMRILGYIGISIRETELINYSVQEENTQG
jgi:hypothetical protein